MNIDPRHLRTNGLAAFFALAAVSLVLYGCGGGGGGGGGGDGGQTPDTTAPAVISTSPAINASNVAINASISVTFSENMNPASIDNTSFTVRVGATQVAGTVVCAGTTATFTPQNTFAHNTSCTASVSTAVKDLAGNALAQAYSWNFTTGAASDTTPPQVSSKVPDGNATNVPITSSISATFSEAMDPTTINSSSFRVEGPGGSIPGIVGYSVLTGMFTPVDNLAYGALYTATVTTAAKDLAGNAFQANHTWNFTTVSGPSPSQSLWDSMIWNQDNWE